MLSPKIKKTTLGILACAGVLIVLSSALLFVFTGSLCENQVVDDYISPSGKNHVVQFVRNCGATTDFVTNLELKSLLLDKKIISIKGVHEDDLSLEWIDDVSVKVRYSGDTDKIYSYKTQVSGVNVSYVDGVDQELQIDCLYYECRERNRNLEIQRRQEWCNYSPENRAYCDQKPQEWEACGNDDPCIYNGPNT